MTNRLQPPLDRASAVAAGLVAAHGVTVLVGWWTQWSLFVHPSEKFIPMAPATAVAFVVLGLALLTRVLDSSISRKRAVPIIAWTVGAGPLINLLFPAWLDGLLGGAAGQFGLVRLGVMSPVTETWVLLMSGYSQEAVFQNEIVEVSTAFLPKPFSVQQLTTKVREVLDVPIGG